ncbi:hypothetical protein GCM10009037_30520 [Halarchaeum grantii]|uniref:Peptidase M48 domain-containing protein n=1 Tax=Halarchaeum grantii TaxID=1193105 RepID=A0A830FEA6_9EURY|nr:hypothetical protein [Halarchaeum grantii]GGL44994.1 hypothetical protein GCM10009037_30520 [Halarchaeum grantii]
MRSPVALTGLLARLRDPFDVYEIRWATALPRPTVESRLDDAFERTADDATGWRHDHTLVYTDRLSVTDDGEVRIVRRWPAAVRLAVLGLVLLAPLVTASVWSVFLYFGLAALLQGHPDTDPPLQGCVETTREAANGLVGVTMLLSVVAALRHFDATVDSWLVTPLAVAVLLLVLVNAYLEDSLPFVTPDLSKRVLLIPYNFLALAGPVLMLFFPIVVFSAWVSRTGDRLAAYTSETLNRASRSVLSDMLGTSLPATGQIDAETIRHLVMQLFVPYARIALLAAAISLFLWVHTSRTTVRALHRYRLDRFASDARRAVVFLLYAAFTALLYTVTAVAVAILAFGVTGVYPLPDATLQPLLTLLPADTQPTPTAFLVDLYRTLDYTFRDAGLPARAVGIGYLCLLLWPFVFVALGTVTELLARPIRVATVFLRSSSLPEDDGQDLLPDAVEVRRIDRAGFPALRPLSLPLGLGHYVFVSDVLVAECSRAELHALLEHEHYHIRERSLGVGATVLSSLLGGTTLLPAFYDYRESERAADAAAAAVLDARTVRDAIRRIYELRARTDGTPLALPHPGIVGADTRTPQGDATAVDSLRDAVERLRTTVYAYGTAPYRLYFGSVLVDTAHLRKRERLDALRDLED